MPTIPKFRVYMDEAGDPGVREKLNDEPDWTDWFVISAIVVSEERDKNLEVVDWVRDMAEAVRSQGSSPLHYRNLSETNKERVCRMLARKPVRIFTVASHKNSMRSHKNRKLGRANSRDFYNWCLRLLLERVTEWCFRRCQNDGLEEPNPARLIFSERGGHNYQDLKDYIRKLQAQTLTGKLVLNRRGLAPGIIREDLFDVIRHDSNAGLQLADIAASAFLQASCSVGKKHTLEPAKILKPRVAIRDGEKSSKEFGLLRLPFSHQGSIPKQDEAIFKFYGYSFPK